MRGGDAVFNFSSQYRAFRQNHWSNSHKSLFHFVPFPASLFLVNKRTVTHDNLVHTFIVCYFFHLKRQSLLQIFALGASLHYTLLNCTLWFTSLKAEGKVERIFVISLSCVFLMLTKGRGLDSQRGVQNPRLWVSFPPILSIPLLLVFSLSAHAPTTQNRSAPLLRAYLPCGVLELGCAGAYFQRDRFPRFLNFY